MERSGGWKTKEDGRLKDGVREREGEGVKDRVVRPVRTASKPDINGLIRISMRPHC